MLQAIVAISDDGFIGASDAKGLPWKLSPDMKRFKELTMGHAIIMGRRTFESIGRALPGRENIVISRREPSMWEKHAPDGYRWVRSPDEAIKRTASIDPNPFVIGGAEIYRAMWPQVDRVHLTRVHREVKAGVHFEPDWKEFRRIHESTRFYPEGGFSYSFIALERAS